jgi:fatty acid desaturase
VSLTKLNAGIVGGLLLINVWMFLVVPVMVPVWALTLIPLAICNNTLWSAIHEAIHGNLPKWCGVALSAVFGSSFHFLAAGHLTHHALNRTVETLEIIKPGENIWVARLHYYFFLCGGLYLSEMLVPIAFIFTRPKSKHPFFKVLFTRADANSWKIAAESVVTMGFMTASLYLYGHRWPVFVAILAARALLVSALDYIYHYGNPVGDVMASNNLQLPFSVFIMHFNRHHDHHLSPKTPWNEHPAEVHYNKTYMYAALAVWKGPIPPPAPPPRE